MLGMKRIAARGAWWLAAFMAVPFAHAQEDAPAALDDAQIAQTLLDAEAKGRAIYLHDQAAAVATDAVMKLKAFRQDGKRGQLAGWITEQRDEGIVVTFLSSESIPRARYRATVASDGRVAGEVVALEKPEALSSYELGAARARATAAAAKFEPCSKTYNTVVLRDDRESGGWTAYWLPGTTKQGIVPIGGSHRMDLDATGEKIVSQRGFTRTCIALDNPRDAVGLVISHLLDPVPTEIHVFWSLWAGKSMYVATSDGTWKIQDGAVTLLERRKKEAR